MRRRRCSCCSSRLAGFARADDTLHLYIWNNYISAETAARFEAWCGCRLKQDYYSDNEEMLAKLEAGAAGYDLLVPTGNAVHTLIRKNELQALDHQRLPHLANIAATFADPWYDPGLRHAVPYATTVTLLGFNATKLAELGLPTDSWALIFEPVHLQKLKGKVTVLNSQRELMAAALRYLGHPVNDTDPDHWRAARDLILRAKPYWATFSNSTYIKDLAIGNIWVAHGYSNDMFRARAGRPRGRPAVRHRFRDPQGRRGAGGGQLRHPPAPPAVRTSPTASSTSCCAARMPPTSPT